MKSPSFQFYPDDFIAGVADMNQNEVGAYILLLCHQWNVGKIPEEISRLKRIARGKVSSHVLKKFRNGKNARLEKVRKQQDEWREKRRINGKNGADKRWHNHGEAMPEPSETNSSPAISLPLAKNSSLVSSLSPPSPSTKLKSDKGEKALVKLTAVEKEIADRFEKLLGEKWVNDAGKWINRIKEIEIIEGVQYKRNGWFEKCERIVAEVESANKENRINTTPAQYAEQMWKEFK